MSPRFSAAVGRTLSSVRQSRNFRLYLTGQTISAIGMWMNFTASAWLVLELTGSGTALGTHVALYFLPVLLFAAYGGVLADRFDKRRILMLTQCGYGAVATVLFVLVAADVVELWMVYVAAVASGLVTALDNPTRQSFYVEMVGEAHVRNAVSLNSAVFTGSRVVGPAIAGLLITTVGMAMCFLIDAVSYIAVLIALALMRTADLHPQKRSTRDRGHLVAGLKYVWRTDDLRRPLIAMAIVFTFAFNFAIFVPLLAEEHVRRRRGDLRRAVGAGGRRLLPRGDHHGQPLGPASHPRSGLVGVRHGRGPDPAGLSPTLLGGGPHDDPDGVHADGLHDHGQHDAAAVVPSRGPWPRDGACTASCSWVPRRSARPSQD